MLSVLEITFVLMPGKHLPNDIFPCLFARTHTTQDTPAPRIPKHHTPGKAACHLSGPVAGHMHRTIPIQARHARRSIGNVLPITTQFFLA